MHGSQLDFLANSLVQDLTFSNLKQFGFEWRSSYPLGIHWRIPHFSAGCEAASLHRQFEWCVRLLDATNHSFTEAVVSSVKDFKWRDLQFFMFVCWLGDDSTAANCDYQWCFNASDSESCMARRQLTICRTGILVVVGICCFFLMHEFQVK